MTKVYVAHPYGGNVAGKRAVQEIIRRRVAQDSSVLYISPIHALGYMYDDVPYSVGMDWCLELLSMCDKLLLCGAWRTSRGCLTEQAYAEHNGILIEYLDEVGGAG